jgi:hypothetical protein
MSKSGQGRHRAGYFATRLAEPVRTPPPHARLSGCRTFWAPSGHDPFERLDLEALAGEVLLIENPGHFAIDSGLLYVVATAVVGDLEDFEGEVFRLTRAIA